MAGQQLSTPAGQGPAVRDVPELLKGGKAAKAAGDAPVIPILLAMTGGYLVWFGVHYWRDQVTVLPSDPAKALLQGKGLPAPSRGTSATATLTAYEAAAAAAPAGSTGPGGPGGTAPQGSVPAGSAQNTAKLLLGKYGWGPSEMAALITLWNGESSWNSTARNSSSGAYGIAQALGHGGAGTAAANGTNEYGAEYGLTAAEAQAANSGDARWQIEWGLGYIKSVYGSPSAALAAWNSRSPHWY